MRMYQRNDICNLLKEILFENIHIYSLSIYSRSKHFLITSMSSNKHRKSLKSKLLNPSQSNLLDSIF